MTEPAAVSLLHVYGADVPGEEQGQLRHRVINPVRVLNGSRGLAPAAMSWRHPDAPLCAMQADLVVLHQLAGFEIETLILERRRDGRATLYEIGDELSAAVPWSRLVPPQRSALSVGRQLLHAWLADGLQFASAGLLERYAEINPRHAVLDNFVTFPARPAVDSAGFVFGWAGTRSHAEDLKSIAGPIASFCRRHADAVFALMGDPELWEIFADVPSAQFRTRPFSSYEDYVAFLATLRVGVIPLGSSAFNRGRSDIKLVEMVAAGAAVIAQDAPAYSAWRDDVCLYRDDAELGQLLERLHGDRDNLARLAERQRTAVQATRAQAAVRAQHETWYRSFDPAGTGALAPRAEAANELTQMLDDVVALAGSGDQASAATKVRRLLELAPDYVQARWFAVNLLTDQGREAEALACGAPLERSWVFRDAWFVLATRLTGDVSRVAQIQSPALRLLATRRDPRELGAYHRELLAVHPFDYFALAATERQLRADGDPDAAAILRRRLQLVTPERPPSRVSAQAAAPQTA